MVVGGICKGLHGLGLLMFGIAQAFHCTVEWREMCGLISGEWFCGGLGKWGRLLG